MKKLILPLFAVSAMFLFACSNSSSQEEVVEEIVEIVEEPVLEVLDPVKWEYNTEKVTDNEYKITFNAVIEDSWYVYSSTVEDDGPIPTGIFYDENENLGTLSEIEEDGEVTKNGYDEMFDMDIKKFGHTATFSQVVTVTGPTTLTGYLEFMTCDSMQCLFPDPIEFTIDAN